MIAEKEYKERVHALRNIMVREKTDAIITYANNCSPGNVQYFSNFQLNFAYGAASAIMVFSQASEEPSLLISSYPEWNKAKLGREAFPILDTHVRYSNNYANDILEILGQNRIGVVGVGGMQAFPAGIYQELRSSLPKVQFKNAQGLIDELRGIKSQNEIELLRKSGSVAGEAMQKALDAISEGKKEREVAIVAEVAMRKAGAQTLVWFPHVASGKERTLFIELVTSERTIEKGDFVIVDVGARLDGYCSDMTRTRVCGKPTTAQKDLFETVLQIYRKALDTVRPGVSAYHVHETAEQVAKEAGYTLIPPIGGGWVGHGVGVDCNERPAFREEFKDIKLKPNMVFTVEPGIYLPGVGGVRIEDTLRVTENSPEILTKCPISL